MDIAVLATIKRDGYMACSEGVKFIDNPYSCVASDEEFEYHMAWNEGYALAEADRG